MTTAHETTTEFNDEIIKEHNIFELSKQQEMKEMFGSYADGHIDFYRKVSRARVVSTPVCTADNAISQAIEDWDSVIPQLSKIRVDI